jgi:hypothetical protein
MSPKTCAGCVPRYGRSQTSASSTCRTPPPELRLRVIRAMPEAEEPPTVGGGGVTFTDPPALGAMRRRTEVSPARAFLHEQPSWRGGVYGRPTYQLVLEGIESADAVLAAQGRRTAPAPELLDRPRDSDGAHAACLPRSVILGESAGKIDCSAWGLPLRLLAVVADILVVYGAGKLFGWW